MGPFQSQYSMVNDNPSNVQNQSLASHQTTDSSTSNATTLAPTNMTSPWSFEFSATLATILSISAFLTVVGNIMVLMVIIRHRGMRTRTNLFLVNLAVADLLVGLFVLPFPITTLIEGGWIFKAPFVCSLNCWMNAFCLVTSIHTLMYIGIHKFFSIVKPLNNPLNLQHIICMMSAAWFWGAFCATFALLGFEAEYKRGTSQCGPKYPKEWRQFIFHGIFQTTVVILPFIILVYCYVRMFREIKRHSERLRNNSTVEEDFLITQQKKVTITLFIVLTCFVMMVLPYFSYATYTTIKKDKDHFSSYLNPLAYLFLYLSSMCNPIIYAFRSPAFREGYKEILCQTPNYVISDESADERRSSRFSTMFNFRRYSRPSVSASNATSMIDNESVPDSPSPYLSNNKGRKWPNNKKSLVSLVRSTRQSKASSVIHRNGETIIIKGGKIVSVRRNSDSVVSISKEPARPLFEMAKNVADSANTTVCGIALTVGNSEAGGENDGLKPSNNGRTRNVSSTKSETEISFEEMDSDLAELNDSNVFENNVEDGNSFVKHRTIPEGEEICETEPTNDQKSSQPNTFQESRFIGPTPSIKIDGMNDETPSIKIDEMKDNTPSIKIDEMNNNPQSQSPLHQKAPALSKMVLNIASNTDMLVGIPLSPRTKDILTKSTMNLSAPPTTANTSNINLALSRSTDDLNPCGARFKRRPSVEHLDPPVKLFRSRSSAGHRSPHGKSSPLLRPRHLNLGSPANV